MALLGINRALTYAAGGNVFFGHEVTNLFYMKHVKLIDEMNLVYFDARWLPCTEGFHIEL